MNRKATIFRCPNCGELSIYPRNEGTEFLCECGGKLIPEAQANVGADTATRIPQPKDRETMYLCDHRACSVCTTEIRGGWCQHTRDIRHAKNFHNFGGSFVEDEAISSKADRTVSIRAKVDTSELDSALDKVRALRDVMEGTPWMAVRLC